MRQRICSMWSKCVREVRREQVLNMKPPEILAMVEEAAGTKMYEANKINAVKLIDKKQKKLAEIQEVCAEWCMAWGRLRQLQWHPCPRSLTTRLGHGCGSSTRSGRFT